MIDIQTNPQGGIWIGLRDIDLTCSLCEGHCDTRNMRPKR